MRQASFSSQPKWNQAPPVIRLTSLLAFAQMGQTITSITLNDVAQEWPSYQIGCQAHKLTSRTQEGIELLRRAEMSKNISITLVVVAMIVTIVAIDVLFFRNLFWERLMVNIGIVLVFAAFFLRFIKHP